MNLVSGSGITQDSQRGRNQNWDALSWAAETPTLNLFLLNLGVYIEPQGERILSSRGVGRIRGGSRYGFTGNRDFGFGISVSHDAPPFGSNNRSPINCWPLFTVDARSRPYDLPVESLQE